MDGASQRNGGGRQREGGKQREGRSGLRRAGREYLEMPQGQGKDRSDCLHLFVVAGREYLEMPPHFEAGEVRVQVPPRPETRLDHPSPWLAHHVCGRDRHRRCWPYSHRQPARLPSAHQGLYRPTRLRAALPPRTPRVCRTRRGMQARQRDDARQKAVLVKWRCWSKSILVKRRYWSKGDARQRRYWSKGGNGQKAMLVTGGAEKAVRAHKLDATKHERRGWARRTGAEMMRRMSGSCRDKEEIRVRLKIKTLPRV